MDSNRSDWTARLRGSELPRRLRTIARATAFVGGPLFLLGVLLHPARHGEGIQAVGQLYGITHAVQAIALLLQVVCLASVYQLTAARFGRRGLSAFGTALVGTVLWFGLIVLDGSRNPVTARYAPDIVHTPADLDIGGAMLVLPALLVFPLGYALLAALLIRHETIWTGLLLGVGALVYTAGGLAIFAFGPHSPLIQILEVAGAAPYALGFILLGHSAPAAPDADDLSGIDLTVATPGLVEEALLRRRAEG
ncbi:MAG: hypothetical protein ACRDRZ_06735 [Pseudonocardiaceae bacterium]